MLTRSASRRGFSLTELLVAFTLIAVLGLMLTRFLLAQSRFTEHQHALQEARMVSRHALNVLESELRMVQDSGGLESVSADGKTITALVPYRFGLYCGNVGQKTVASLLPVDSLMAAQAIFAGYAWRGQSGAYTTVFTTTAPVTSATPTQCTNSTGNQAGIRTFTLSGRPGAVVDLTPAITDAMVGQPLFLFQRVTYEFRASTRVPGTIGLWRTVQGGTPEELLALFDSGARFKYWTTNAAASVAAPPNVALIRGLDVVLSARSAGATRSTGEVATSEVVATIFFRNVRKN
jgi:prepilin-type N-terminal cleavage/methylation domain-containing protein